VTVNNSNIPNHLFRPRINALLASSVKKPLTIVCAGAGCGKTLAVYDFTRSNMTRTIWLQISGQDNVGSRFWENFVSNATQVIDFAFTEIKELGFPDTEDKFSQFISLCNLRLPNRHFILVTDDVHLINDHAVAGFLERFSHNIPQNISLVFICRELTKINITSQEARNLITIIDDSDLNFTESELAQFLHQQGVHTEPLILRQIFQDTNGWAFAVNLIARSLKKAPRYLGYVQNAVKQSIFNLMETEVWDEASERLQRFMTRISLIDHLSKELVTILAAGDDSLLAELGRQNAYIHFDGYINAYLINNLFLDFLRIKQEALTDGERSETYSLAADWCRQNGFIVDALSYYEKIGDYESIVSIFIESLIYLPHDLAKRALGIFERAPADTFDRVKFFAVMHIFTVINVGRWQEFFRLTEYYEQKFLKLEDSDFRNHTLGGIYLYWGYMRLLMCTIEDNYNFDVYYARMADCFIEIPPELVKRIPFLMGPWISLVGSARKGAPMEYIEALTRMVGHVSRCSHITAGYVDLTLGELLFYQDNIQAAEPLFNKTLVYARENRQFEAVHIALHYIARIAVLQGNREKVEQALKGMEMQLYEKEYYLGFFTYDIAIGWYYYILRRPEMLPGWLKEKFSPYDHAYFAVNFGNQMKARYHYLTKNYQPLITYITEMKRRESILYGRVELLAIEACVYYQMKDKKAAFATLREAYDTAAPNEILMPFIEQGKDMRSLASSALREPDNHIPQSWLEAVRRRSATYAKYHSSLSSDFRNARGRSAETVLTAREREFLFELYNGLNRSEIAAKKTLSINTVNSVISSLFNKLDAHSIVDAIRVAKERDLV